MAEEDVDCGDDRYSEGEKIRFQIDEGLFLSAGK